VNIRPVQIEPPPRDNVAEKELVWVFKNVFKGKYAAAVPTHPQLPAIIMQINPITFGKIVDAEDAMQAGAEELDLNM